jgi:alkyl hydroperoxide reductase subunit F
MDKESTTYDLIIIGGGPAGASAAVYAARKQLKTLLILKEWGGQSTVSDDIQNWIGTPHISGTSLAKSLEAHVLEYKGEILTIHTGAYVSKVEKINNIFSVSTEDSKSFNSKAVLVATGSERRKLDIPGATEFEHKGITYCASCDGPLFSGQEVVVIGGGNAGFESAAQLLAYCKNVTLLNRSDTFKADAITIEKLSTNPNFTIISNAIPTEVRGDIFADTLVYKDSISGELSELKVGGIFVEIGQLPATSFVKGLVAMTPGNQIMINPRTQETDVPGIWAAGDCTDVLYHQNNIAAGDAVRALEDIYLRLHTS